MAAPIGGASRTAVRRITPMKSVPTITSAKGATRITSGRRTSRAFSENIATTVVHGIKIAIKYADASWASRLIRRTRRYCWPSCPVTRGRRVQFRTAYEVNRNVAHATKPIANPRKTPG